MHKIILLVIIFQLCKGLSANNSSDGSGNENLMAKMDYLEFKLMELQVEIKEQSEVILHKLESNKRVVIEQTSDILENQRMAANYEELKQSIFKLSPRKHPSDNSKILDCLVSNNTFQKRSTIISCESSKTSGTYLMAVDQSTQFEVYCENNLHDGGWIVIQNRFNGSVDFYRNWTEYKNGFGDLNGEFWLGLDKIHALTKTGARELLIQLEDFAGNVYYSKYGSFEIGSEDEKFDLKSTLVYQSGIMGDSLTYHKGQKFTTYDSDNDVFGPANCAINYLGAWWYVECLESNLNGLYGNATNAKTICWKALNPNYQGMSASKMMIK